MKKKIGQTRKKKDKRNHPRPLTLVKFVGPLLFKKGPKGYPLKRDRVYVYLGEIANMPDHCVVVEHKSGRLFSGYHAFDFVELSEDEI